MGRLFKFANIPGTDEKAFKEAQLPKYMTKHAAGADFFCAEEIKIPSFWKAILKNVFRIKSNDLTAEIYDVESNLVREIERINEAKKLFKPTLVHTGIKAVMDEDDVLYICNRSSGPKNGLILANSIGVIDADYANNPNNDGEIMFAFYNILPWDITIKVGDRIGQGIFHKFLRPDNPECVLELERTSGFGSTNKKKDQIKNTSSEYNKLVNTLHNLNNEKDENENENENNSPELDYPEITC